MLAYFISSSNQYSIRTEVTSSNQWTMSLQDMTLLTNTTASLSGITYDGYESILAFTASISPAIVGSEYRVSIINSGSGEIWHGSLQAYESQSNDKTIYVNQIPLEGRISHASTNQYIILE
jgi:hypothetical protein